MDSERNETVPEAILYQNILTVQWFTAPFKTDYIVLSNQLLKHEQINLRNENTIFSLAEQFPLHFRRSKYDNLNDLITELIIRKG